MNNSSVAPLHWSRLIGLCPLVAIGLAPGDAMIFGAALILTLVLTAGCVTLLQRWIAAAQQLIATALIATIAVSIIDLLLQAVCYEHAQNLQLFLPLLMIVALLLQKNAGATRLAIRRTLTSAAQQGGLFALALIIFATLHAFIPIEASTAFSLIGSGLLLAAATKIYPNATGEDTPPTDSPRIRARVTGPVR